MKAKKLIAIIAFAGLGFTVEGAYAQNNDQTQQAAPATQDPATPAVNDSSADPDSYNEKVTIDDGSGTTTGTSDASAIAAPAEKKEKLRVYSGKHDGNNVIVDPR